MLIVSGGFSVVDSFRMNHPKQIFSNLEEGTNQRRAQSAAVLSDIVFSL